MHEPTTDPSAVQAAGGMVPYDWLDGLKVLAQRAAARTSHNLLRHGIDEVAGTRGESCYLVEQTSAPARYEAHVEETLGTKNIVADAVYDRTGDPVVYGRVARCGVRMITNDVATSGARVRTVAMHLALHSQTRLADPRCAAALMEGGADACDQLGAIMAGGDTPGLDDLVAPGRFILNGSATGFISYAARRICGDVADGDRIVLVQSTGIHANGLTDGRRVATLLPEGYATRLPSGRSYGDALLTPTADYHALVQRCLDLGVVLHACVNVTGHGWRKLMRAVEPFTYTIEQVPPVPEELQLIGSTLGYSPYKMYGTFNMGAGFALILPADDVAAAIRSARELGMDAHDAGYVTASTTRRVVIEPVGVTYEAETLAIR